MDEAEHEKFVNSSLEFDIRVASKAYKTIKKFFIDIEILIQKYRISPHESSESAKLIYDLVKIKSKYYNKD